MESQSAHTIENRKSLAPVPLQLELGGRLRNIGRPKHWYMAVAEAIKNSLDAIEDSRRKGWVEVRLERGKDLASEGGIGPVRDVVVRDNGVGFNEPNFASFCRPDSLYKFNRGGKGLGRLVCIQAFRQVQVVSVYREGKEWKTREFLLQAEAPELSQITAANGASDWKTEVRLADLREDYLTTAAVQFDQLVDWLSEHFLPALLEKPSWLESLVVKDGRKEKDLTHLVSGGAIWSANFKVKNYDFYAGCYALKTAAKPDMVRLVAGGRVVDANTRSLEHYLPHLEKISDKNTHVVLVRSPFLDEHVNNARNGVSFCEDGEEDALLGITASQFKTGLAEALKKPLSQHLTSSDNQLKSHVEEVVRQEAPYYRPLLLGYFESKDFSDLSKSARNEEILASLDAYKRRDAINLKKESRRLAKVQGENADYWESARQLASKVETQKKVALAEYVTLRKLVLDRLEVLLEAKSDGRASKEEEIHDLVFPKKIDTESTPDIDHQLWILDERLESHGYLASDKPMDGRKGDRPDLLIALDRPGAFASGPSSKAKGYERIVLVEFKRALTDLTTAPTDDLPHRQMMRYALQITQGKAKHLHSLRAIQVSTDVRFYLYAVCELSKPMLERLERDEQFTLSPAGDGAFAVKNNGRYYLEYISLPKLLEDAKARNQAFFQKLGLEG
jgi:hypothetical protein